MSLAYYSALIADGAGNGQRAAMVRVYALGTTNPVQLYSDRGGAAEITQPVRANNFGEVSFFLPTELYTMEIIAPGGTRSRTIAPIPLP